MEITSRQLEMSQKFSGEEGLDICIWSHQQYKDIFRVMEMDKLSVKNEWKEKKV